MRKTEYIGRCITRVEFDGLKSINVKKVILDELEWSWMEGKMVKYAFGEFMFEINDYKHLQNWIKKYKDERVINNIDEVKAWLK